MNYIREYWKKIISGRIVVSKKVFKQYEKLNKDLDAKNKKWHYSDEWAKRPIQFIEKYCHNVKASGELIKLELWQKAYISALFGFVDKNNLRRFKECHLFIAKKQGKSTISACLGLYMLIADGEVGAEIVSGGYTRQQSKIILGIAGDIVNRNPQLRNILKVLTTGIFVKDSSATSFIAASKQADNFDGLNTSCFLCDELHIFRDRSIYEIFKRNTMFRKEPLILITTTMGKVRENIFDEIYDEDEKIIDGIFNDDRRLILIYEQDSEDEVLDEKMWQKSNPMIGKFVPYSDIRYLVESAKNNTSQWNDLLCKNFNIRVTDNKTWLPFDVINNKKKFNIDKFKNCYAIGAFDLSRTGDLTAFNSMFFDKETQEFCCETMYWIPSERLKDNNTQLIAQYKKWIDQGYLRICPGERISYEMISDYIYNEMVLQRGITYLWIYYDSYSAVYLIESLNSYGFSSGKCLMPAIQGFKTLSIPMQELEIDLKENRLNYNNNPVTKWCFTNVELERDRNGNYMPKKYDNKYNRKIDGVAVILNCYVGLVNHKAEFIEMAV